MDEKKKNISDEQKPMTDEQREEEKEKVIDYIEQIKKDEREQMKHSDVLYLIELPD